MGLEHIFPGLPPTPGDVIDGLGDFFSGIADFFSSSGPSAESIQVGMLVKTILHGPGTEGMYQAHRATERQMDIQTELAGQAHELVGRLEAAWTGSSSDGARQLIHSFADAADESSKVLASNARNLQRQVDGFERMRNSLEPMPDPPPEKSAFNPDFSGAAKRRIRRYNQMAERNRQRYQGYVDDTNENLGSMGYDYNPLPDRGGRGGWGGSGGWGPSGSGSGIPMPPRWPGSEPWTPGGGSGGFGPGYQPGQYTPGGYDPSYSGTTAASFGPGSAGGGGAGFGPGAGGGVPGGGIPGGMAGAGADAAGAQSGVAGGARGGGAGAGGRGGGFGPRGGGMMGGAPMGGAGRGQGGDDEEHQRKSWLQEIDPEGLFGSDELTPPPVIGDEDYE